MLTLPQLEAVSISTIEQAGFDCVALQDESGLCQCFDGFGCILSSFKSNVAVRFPTHVMYLSGARPEHMTYSDSRTTNRYVRISL